MEFNNQYLSFEEYTSLGGTLQEMPFNILEYEARKNIDKYTFNRLSKLNEITNDIKLCVYNLINVLGSYNEYNNHSKSISSESTDGYSISYGVASESVSNAKINDITSIINTYLANSTTPDGTPLLYRGC